MLPTSLHRSPSQNKDQFDEFSSGFNMLMSNINDKKPIASIITGGFNARSKNWWSQDITNSQDSIIDNLTSISGYHQLINLLTHRTNKSYSCIDLIFTSNSNLITELGIEKSLYVDSFHHSIIFGKMNLNVPLPPPKSREVWDYNKAEKESIQKSLKICNWARLSINLTINEIVELLSNTLINIFKNYIPNKKIKFKHGEAPWINKNIKSSLRNRSRLTKRYYVNSQVQSDYDPLQSRSKRCTEMLLSAKNEHMLRVGKKLNDPSTVPKSYWSILN